MGIRTANRRWLDRLSTAGLIGPPVVWLIAFYAFPVVFVIGFSLNLMSLFPGDVGLDFGVWRDTLSSPHYRGLLLKSFRMSLTVSVVSVLMAYPVAYFLAFCVRSRKYILFLVIIAPFWTSFLLRVLAWRVILGEQGLLNSAAYWLNLRSPDDPIPHLIYSQFSVMLVLVYDWVPFVVFPIFMSLEAMDRSLMDAAGDLGASRLTAFLKVTLPLSAPGAIAGFLFVFIPTLGEFVTPLLVGGPTGFLYGNAIADLFGFGLDWQTGSVLALQLLAIVLVLAAVMSRFLLPSRVQR